MAVREGLLTLLSEHPRHGYDLRAEFERRTARLWDLNSGQVYTTLDRLARDGLVTATDDPDDPSGRRRLYALTTAGHEALDTWRGALPGDAEPPREDLVMQVLLAAESPSDEVVAIIDRARHHLLGRLQALRREQQTRTAGTDLPADLVAEVLIARHEADLRWLDRVEEILRARQSPPSTPKGSLP